MYKLYKYENAIIKYVVEASVSIIIDYMPLKMFQKRLRQNENISFKEKVLRFYFAVITGGKAEIWFACDTISGSIIHCSYCIPKCYKFPFLSSNEYEIGPCNTIISMRGNKIYPAVISEIIKVHDSANAFYMIVDKNNISSQHGIKRSGFKLIGVVQKTKLFKIYKKMEARD